MILPWSENMIARALALQFFNRKYLVVVPNCTYTGHECDLLCVTENLRVIDIEIKISRADLKADAKKDKWWHREFVPTGENHPKYGWPLKEEKITRAQWPPKVWKHYYAMPKEIWTDDLLASLPSPNSGVLLLRHPSEAHKVSSGVVVQCHRMAKPNRDAKTIPADAAVNIARLASLRMWDSHLQVEGTRRELARERYADDGVRP